MSETPGTRPGGRILVDALRVHGVDRLFCVPGESYLDVLDALYDTPQIAVVVAKHEGAAANMAEADGKLTGRPGICFVTRGPGATHASVGVHTAYQDSTPMILFIGQVQRDVRGREAFQEVEFRQMFAPLAKWVAEIETADRIPEYVLRAFQVATSGRPGPVVLALPEDVLAEQSSVARHATVPRRCRRCRPIADLAAVRDELERASQPLLIVGGSCWSDEGCAALARFAEANTLPVLTSFRRQDLIDNDAPVLCGASQPRPAATPAAAREGGRPDHRARHAPRRCQDDDVLAAQATAHCRATRACPRGPQRTESRLSGRSGR